MDIEFLNGEGVARALQRLMAEHDEFHWAVAWGTHTSLAKTLLAEPQKIKAVTFGLAFAQTDPDLVDALQGIDGAYVVTKFPGGTYHPKVYAFRSGRQVSAIVGSANFTRGGLGNNQEAAVLIRGTTDDKSLADLLAFVGQCAKQGEKVTEPLAQRYRLAAKAAARKPRLPKDPFDAITPVSLSRPLPPLVRMDWPEYVRAIQASQHHDVGLSLELLRIAQTWLSASASFRDLSTPQRKAIAGVIGVQEKAASKELDRDWGWFGSMRGAGDFKNRISENDRFLAQAVDSIPHKGEIAKGHFDRFAERFDRAFENSHRSGNVATASRLLAMKRPDVFLCISKSNRPAAAREMGFSGSTLNLGNYWDRVVEVIRASDWYNSDKPAGFGGQLWECRAAMLDAILYLQD